MVEDYEMSRLDKVAGNLEVEFCFAYGMFGYGYSNQVSTFVFNVTFSVILGIQWPIRMPLGPKVLSGCLKAIIQYTYCPGEQALRFLLLH